MHIYTKRICAPLRRPDLLFLQRLESQIAPTTGFFAVNQEHTNEQAEWKALVEAGNAAYAERKYTEAELKFAAALRLAEKWAGADGGIEATTAERRDLDEQLAKSLNNMAALYHTQGKYKMAEDLYDRCLDLKIRLHGEDHIEVALNLHNLAALHSAKARWALAEPLYLRSLEIKEQVFGKDSPELVSILNNYALMLRRTKRDDEADQLEARAKLLSETATSAAK